MVFVVFILHISEECTFIFLLFVFSRVKPLLKCKMNIRRLSLSTIETCVTRLLVSTKHLLESLTHWARRDATDKEVSDAYVRLGNDFRAATRAFSNAGVDISDIGDIPRALRIILESALSESPTQENLDRFLPNVRSIIVNLLQNLKAKQLKAKALSNEKPLNNNEDSMKQGGTFFDSSKSSRTPSSDKVLSRSPQLLKGTGDALSQLQRKDSLQRRASKRFSAYQYAKLTNNSQNKVQNIVANETRNTDDTILSSKKEEDISDIEKRKDAINVFLRIKEQTKRAELILPVSFASLRLVFVEKFAYSPGSSSFPPIYIQNPNIGVPYELEEHMLTDVKENCILSLFEQDETLSDFKMLENKIKSFMAKFEVGYENKLDQILTSLRDLEKMKDRLNEASQVQDRSKSSSEESVDFKELQKLKHELKIVKQVQSTNKETTRGELSEILNKVQKFEKNGLSISQSSNRAYMDSCNGKLSDGSDSLLTKVDDLQDIMEALRKDVAQRGVRINEKQLKNTEKEIQDAKDALNSMICFINNERANWKKIWEIELDRVCEEQQFFNLQDDLTHDLKEDITKIEETFELVQQCSVEQSKLSYYKKNKINPLIFEPGESIQSVKDNILNDIKVLSPDHEKRVLAISKAEKIRDKEKELMKFDQFQEELGSFVEESKLKKAGGINQVERIRANKDIENLKNSLGII